MFCHAARHRIAFLLLFLLPCCTLATSRHVPEQTELVAEAVEIPLWVARGHYWVRASVNGIGPYAFLFDTGSGVLAIDARIASDAALETWHIPSRLDGVGESRWSWMRAGSVELLALSGHRLGESRFNPASTVVGFRRSECWVLDLAADEGGILGLGLFEDCLLTFDGPRRRLVIERTGELPPPDGKTVFAYRLEGGVPVMDVGLGACRVAVGIDTGFAGWLAVPPSVAKHLQLERDRGIEAISQNIHGTVVREPLRRLWGDLRIGNYRARRPHVVVCDCNALLGVRVLDRFTITFDPKNRRVRFAAPSLDVALPQIQSVRLRAWRKNGSVGSN